MDIDLLAAFARVIEMEVERQRVEKRELLVVLEQVLVLIARMAGCAILRISPCCPYGVNSVTNVAKRLRRGCVMITKPFGRPAEMMMRRISVRVANWP